MDELTQLRRLHDDVEGVTDISLERGRQRLADQMRTTSPSRSSGFSKGIPRPRLVFSAIAVTAVVAIGVGASVIGLGPGAGASAEAAGLLERAAFTSITAADLVVGGGQYLRVETDAVYPAYTTAGDLQNWEDDAVYLSPSTITIYIPAEESDVWVEERSYSEPTTWFDAAGKQAARSNWASMAEDAAPSITRAANGEFYGPRSSEENLMEMPRDGEDLLRYFYDTSSGGSSSPEEDAFVRITTVLRSAEAPADLRSALYEALIHLPGIEVTAQEATLDGRTGVALGRQESSRHYRVEIIVDPSTGLLIGEREVTTRDVGAMPAGTVQAWTAVTTSVVDSAP